MKKDREQFEDDSLNSEALMESYNSLGTQNFQEIGAREESQEQRSDRFSSTHEQAMDSYTEGTIDAFIEDSKNDRTHIPRTTFDEDLQRRNQR